MNRSIEQALLSLMPTHGPNLPPPLVELASSLLAQSRHKVSTLKAEEDIARLYACANIACDRLKTSLNLPPIEPRPPVPPKVYRKLYSHLDQALPNSPLKRSSSGRVRTPSSKLRDSGTSPATTPRSLPSKTTPSKERSLTQFRTPGAAILDTPTKSTGKARVLVEHLGLHPWVLPVIRHVCREAKIVEYSPTILAGMEAIVIPAGRRTKDAWVNGNLPALLGAVLYFVMEQVAKGQEEQETNREWVRTTRKEIIMRLSQARDSVDAKRMDEEDFWEGWQSVKQKDLDEAIQVGMASDWLDSDWFRGVDDVASTAKSPARRRRSGPVKEGKHASGKNTENKMQAKRADNMFQDRYDYLSDERRKDYQEWKTTILMRVTELESNSQDAMDIET